MSGQTPPLIDDTPRNFIGVGTRELLIGAVSIILAVLVFTTEWAFPIRVLLAVLIAGFGLGIAFGRDSKSGRRFEEMLLQVLMFYGRDKFHQKGAMLHTEPIIIQPKAEGKAFFHVQPIDLGVVFFMQVLTIAFYASLMAYLWGGGLGELLKRYQKVFK